jgi:enoyl-CoA hydratase
MTTVAPSLVRIETAGRVGTITLDRPQVHNALNREMVAALSAACARLDDDPQIHVVTIRGEGKSFCSGLDRREPLAPDLQRLLLEGLGDREALYRMRKPTIAALSGAVMGAGLELALCADFLLGDDSCQFAFPEIGLGGMPGAGGTLRMALRTRLPQAMQACMTGRRLGAAEALAMGLLDAVHPAALLPTRVDELAQSIAAQPLAPLLLIKQSIRTLHQPLLAAAMPLQSLSSYACIVARGLPHAAAPGSG